MIKSLYTFPSAASASSSQISRSAEEEENGSICCDIYIDGDGLSKTQKSISQQPLAVSAVLRGSHAPDSPRPTGQKARRCKCCMITVIFSLALVAAVAVAVGVSIGIYKHRSHQPSVRLDSGDSSSSSPASSITITVPFAATAKVAMLSGSRTDGPRTCESLFGDQQDLDAFVGHLEAAHSQRLSHLLVDEVVLTKLSCNNVSYSVPAKTFLSDKQAAALVEPLPPVPSRRRLAAQHDNHLQHRAQSYKLTHTMHQSSSSSESDTLVVYVEMEAKHREQVQKVPQVSSHVAWITRVSKAAAALAAELVPATLTEDFQLQGSSSCALQATQQITAEVVSIQVVYDGGMGSVAAQHSGRKAYTGVTVVIRTEVDPLTGAVSGSHVTRLPVLPDYLPELLPDGPVGGQGGEPGGPITPQPAAARCKGTCSLPNTAAAACVDGLCQVTTCAQGWEDCDSNPTNGCEAHVAGFASDSNHCGSCNKVCLSPLICQMGKCSSGDAPPATSTQPHEQEPQPPSDADEPDTDESEEPKQPPPPTQPQQQPQQQQQDQQNPDPSKPSGPVAPQQPLPPVKPTQPAKPPLPPTKKPKPGYPELRDDVVHVSPIAETVVMDVMGNDDLGGSSAVGATLNIVAQPTVGTVTVLQAQGATERPRLLYKQDIMHLQPGAEAEFYYTVSVPGQVIPAPASVLLLGAVAPSDSSLHNCSTGPSASAPGTVLGSLTRADDAAQAVRLPFAVELYGASYSTAVISSNGWVSLGTNGAQEPCSVDGSWPNAACLGKGPVLAPFWDDLLSDQVLTRHDTSLGAFVIQWTNVMSPSGNTPLGSFQAYLFPNGTVGYVYRDLYGTDQALGTSAVAGIRAPTGAGTGLAAKLMSKALEEVGAGSDQHGSWLFSTAMDDSSGYITMLGSHSRFLSPGTAVIAYPKTSGGVPGAFKPWVSSPSASSDIVWPLLTSAAAPPQPVLRSLTVQHKAIGTPMATLTWDLPKGAQQPNPDFFKLYLAADPLFNELLRHPLASGFKADIPASSRSADVEVRTGHAAAELYAMLMACNAHGCSRSCVGQYKL